MGKSKQRYRPLHELSDRLVFEIANLYVKEGVGAQEISRRLQEEYPEECEAFHLTNEQIRKVLKIAIDRLILRLVPSNEEKLAKLLRMKCTTAFGLAYTGKDVLHKMINKAMRVLDVGGQFVRPHLEDTKMGAAESNVTGGAGAFAAAAMVEQIANAAADEVLQLIRLIGNKKERVHIGLGAGRTAQCVVRRLGELVRLEPDCPPLALHALTPGFSTDPLQSPVTYFRFFENSGDINYVGLSTAPFVAVDDLPNLQLQPGYAKALEAAQEIDIVISSLAQADDEHGMLKRYLQRNYTDTFNRLKEKDWKGDVQFSPYSNEPLELDAGVRAVSLLGLDDLRKMIETPDKYVVLVAGPCNSCGAPKTAAIEPLLVQASLNLWTHMVMDAETAEFLIDDLPEVAATADPAESAVVQTRRADRHNSGNRGETGRRPR